MDFSSFSVSSDDKGILELMTHLHHISHEMVEFNQHPEMEKLSSQAVYDIFMHLIVINQKYIDLKSSGEI